MPKQIFTINDFSGGLVTDKSPRSLEDNELASCQNFDVSSKGKVIPSRVFKTTSLYGNKSGGTAPNAGYGLTTFSNDRLISDTSVANTGEFLVYVTTNPGGSSHDGDVDILEIPTAGDNTSAWEYGAGIIEGAGDVTAFYSAEGDLFFGGSDRAFGFFNPQSFTFHQHTLIPSADSPVGGTKILNWVAETQAKPIPAIGNMGIGQTSSVLSSSDTAFNSSGGQNIYSWLLKPLTATVTGGDAIPGLWSNTYDGSDYYEYAASYLYKNKAESDLVKIQNGSNDTPTGSYEKGMTGATSFTDVAIMIQCWHNSGNAPTATSTYGARLYARSAVEKGDWYLLAEMDLEKGIKGDGESEWNPWTTAIASAPNFDHGATGDQCTTGAITAPPALQTYEFLNGYSTGDIPDTNQVYADGRDRIVQWKTGIIANSRAYVGNVSLNNREYGDRILKSPLYQYDVFSENSYLDVAINDGDQITALAGYGDRILEFKSNIVYIINASKDLEFLEDQQKGAGVVFQAAVVTTPFGIVWVNENSCYLYDGEKITSLKQGKISDSEWDSDISPAATIGYDVERQHVVIQRSNGSSAYIFDIKTGGWSVTTDIIVNTAASPSTNMVNTKDNKLLIAGGTDNVNIYFLADRTSAASGFSLKTKVFDFGNPESKKNLLEVAVAYNGYGHGSLDFDIITDDGTSTHVTDTAGDALRTTAGSSLVQETDVSGLANLQGQKTFQIHINGTCDHRFELNSITLTYRDLGVH